MPNSTDKETKSQSDKFKQAAKDIGADESEANWERRLKKVVKANQHPEAN